MTLKALGNVYYTGLQHWAAKILVAFHKKLMMIGNFAWTNLIRFDPPLIIL